MKRRLIASCYFGGSEVDVTRLTGNIEEYLSLRALALNNCTMPATGISNPTKQGGGYGFVIDFEISNDDCKDLKQQHGSVLRFQIETAIRGLSKSTSFPEADRELFNQLVVRVVYTTPWLSPITQHQG